MLEPLYLPNLKMFNLLTGENGVGKTTLLKNLLFYGTPTSAYFRSSYVTMRDWLLAIIAESGKRGVWIEDIETGIHFSNQVPFCEAVKVALEKHECHLIATTQSYEFIMEAASVFQDKFMLYRLQWTPEKQRQIIAIDHEAAQTIIEHHFEVR